jgi:hypothetical protein
MTELSMPIFVSPFSGSILNAVSFMKREKAEAMAKKISKQQQCDAIVYYDDDYQTYRVTTERWRIGEGLIDERDAVTFYSDGELLERWKH